MSMMLAALAVFAYLLGAIPFGVLVARGYGVDVRKVGSGNIGATNVKRAIETAGGPGMLWMVVVFVLDLTKGFAPTLAARFVAPGQELSWFLVGFATVAGHCASPFLGFKGGKGVATSLGMVFGASPIVAAVGFGVFLVCLGLSRYVSLSSIVGVACSVLAGAALRDWVYVGVGSAIFCFVVYTHRNNIQRLRAGTEPKFSLRKGTPRLGPDGSALGPDGSALGPDESALGPDESALGPEGSALGPDESALGPEGSAPGRDGISQPRGTA